MTAEIPRRLSCHPTLHRRYLDELQRLLDEVWDPAVLLNRVDSFAAQVESAEVELEDFDGSTGRLRTWIEARRADMQAFIDEGGERGAERPTPCAGNSNPADFLELAEIGSTASLACQTGRGATTWSRLLGLWTRRSRFRRL